MSENRFPYPAFPMGWFQVAYSDEIGPGGVKPLKYFGKDLVLFRTEAGKAVVLDAFCPHLGAHLGYGGKVSGDSIVCPFHAWEYDCTGQCTKVPYGTRKPKAARIRPWDLREVNGLIMVWHHPEGEAPLWEIPEVEEYASDEWTEYSVRRWKIRTRNQEMAENTVDTQHFHYVHGASNHPTAEFSTDGHILYSSLNPEMQTPMGPVEGKVQIEAYGFGFTVTRFLGLAETLLVNSVTPIDEEYVDARFSFTVKKIGGGDVTRGIGAAFIREIERQVEQDKPIWENKAYVRPPILSDEDGPIMRYRRWAAQFYTDPVGVA